MKAVSLMAGLMLVGALTLSSCGKEELFDTTETVDDDISLNGEDTETTDDDGMCNGGGPG